MAGLIINTSTGSAVWPKGIYIDTSAATKVCLCTKAALSIAKAINESAATNVWSAID